MVALSQAFRVTAATKGAQFLFRKKNSSSLVKHEDGFVCVGVPQAPLSLEAYTLQMFPECWVRKEEQGCKSLGQVYDVSLPNARTEGTNKRRTCAGLCTCQVLSAALMVGLDFKSSFLQKRRFLAVSGPSRASLQG